MQLRRDRLDLYILLFLLSVWQMQTFGADTRILISICCGVVVLLNIVIKGKIAKQPAKMLLPLILIVLVGSISALYGGDSIPLHNYLRDIYYILPVCLMFYHGYILSTKYSKKEVASVIVWANVIATIDHLAKVLRNINYITNLNYLRNECGAISHLNTIALVLVLFGDEYISERIKRHRLLLTLSFALSEILYFTRTGILDLGIFVLIVYVIKFRSMIKRATKFVLVILICIVTVYYANPSIVDSFIEKINYSLIEIGMKENRATSTSDMMFREREIVQVKKEFEDGDAINKIIGFGIGHNVKLGESGYRIVIDGEEFTEAGMIHNGFYKVLSIAGVLGLILFVLFHTNILAYAWHNRANMSDVNYRFIISLVVVLLITTYTVIGIYAKGSNYPYIIALTVFIYGKAKTQEECL